MDVALAIFNIGVGLGVLAAGIALAYLAWQTRPLIRESRELARDVRHLARTVDAELQPMLDRAREATAGVEVLSADIAVGVDRLTEAAEALERSVASSASAVAGRSEPRPVESWETREDAASS